VEDIVCALLVGRPLGKTTIRFGGTGTMEIDDTNKKLTKEQIQYIDHRLTNGCCVFNSKILSFFEKNDENEAYIEGCLEAIYNYKREMKNEETKT